MKKLLWLLILISCALAGCGDDSASASTVTDPRKMPIEYQLVFLSVGKKIPANDPSVEKTKQLLENASALYGQTQKEIADIAVKANGALGDKGIKESPIEILEATALANGWLPMKGEYQTLTVTYMTMRVQGMTRAEAIVGLRNFLKVSTRKS